MAETCCVEGCVPAKEDVTYFKFPNSKSLRRKWLDAIAGSVKVTLDTAVCSQHFLAEQYELVRGKRRLKAKVVPSVFAANNISKPKSPRSPHKSDSSDSEDSIPLERVKSVTTDNTDTELSRPSLDHRLEDRENSLANGVKEDEIVKSYHSQFSKFLTNGSLRFSKRKQPEHISTTDSESNKDIEDIITHYQIKQIRPLHKPTDTDMSIEIEVPAAPYPVLGDTGIAMNGEIGDIGTTDNVIDVEDEAEPVFIEVAVGKGGEEEDAPNQDCMMLLESVQCEVDPSCLMFPPDDPDPDPGDDSDVIDLGEKKEDPVSLLTSSDEDEVIIEEPKYDMIEVSDETDEDDVPLVKLLDRPKTKTKKLAPGNTELPEIPTSARLSKILWGRLYEYYCFECKFCSTSKAEHTKHLAEHSTIVQCEICSYTTSSKHQFIRHKRKHRGDKRYKCHLCKYKARHNMSLIYHLKSHNVEVVSKQGVLRCEKCKFETVSKEGLLKHVRACSTQSKRFCCDHCEYETDRRNDMKRHSARKHAVSSGHEDDDDCVPSSKRPRNPHQYGKNRNPKK